MLCGVEKECLCDFHCQEVAALLAEDREQERNEEAEFDWYLDTAARSRAN